MTVGCQSISEIELSKEIPWKSLVTNLSKYFEASAKTWREAIIAWNKYVLIFSEKMTVGHLCIKKKKKFFSEKKILSLITFE